MKNNQLPCDVTRNNVPIGLRQVLSDQIQFYYNQIEIVNDLVQREFSEIQDKLKLRQNQLQLEVGEYFGSRINKIQDQQSRLCIKQQVDSQIPFDFRLIERYGKKKQVTNRSLTPTKLIPRQKTQPQVQITNKVIDQFRNQSKVLQKFSTNDITLIFNNLTQTPKLSQSYEQGQLDFKVKLLKKSIGLVELDDQLCFGWRVACTDPKYQSYSPGTGYLFTLRNELDTLPMKFQVKYDHQDSLIHYEQYSIGFGRERKDLYIDFKCPSKSHSNLGHSFTLVDNIDGYRILGGTGWKVRLVEVFEW